MKAILRDVSDSLTNKPVTVTVEIRSRNKIHAFLQRMGIAQKRKVFNVTQITLGNLVRISKLLVGIEGDLNQLFKDVSATIANYAPFISQIVSIGLHNQKTEPPESLCRFIENNITSAEIADVLTIIIKQMNVSGFMNTIILIRGLNILEMSRNPKGSSIAPGTQSAVS